MNPYILPLQSLLTKNKTKLQIHLCRLVTWSCLPRLSVTRAKYLSTSSLSPPHTSHNTLKLPCQTPQHILVSQHVVTTGRVAAGGVGVCVCVCWRDDVSSSALLTGRTAARAHHPRAGPPPGHCRTRGPDLAFSCGIRLVRIGSHWSTVGGATFLGPHGEGSIGDDDKGSGVPEKYV